ncbi:MAG: AzlC family ABC transporter permease [Lentisphaeria bacterium]|nr:AzlC family ABC transporter permease [Lentisphaeria bacterium]
MNRKPVLKQAFVSSLPVLMGYTTMGFAAGVLLATNSGVEHPALWAFLTSATSISGALQFMLVDWIQKAQPMLEVALLTVCLNIRYSMYGLSLVERFRGLPIAKKLYLIWSLTDETYALEVENKVPPGGDSILYCLTLAALNHCYWIIGVVSGALAGTALPFPNKGIDFAMTALFLVILTDQCRECRNRVYAAVGLLASVVCALVFGAGRMLIPSIILMLSALIVFRKPLEKLESWRPGGRS